MSVMVSVEEYTLARHMRIDDTALEHQCSAIDSLTKDIERNTLCQ